MKIDFGKLLNTVGKVAVPIATAVVLHKMTTGKIDVKGAIEDEVQRQLNNRGA